MHIGLSGRALIHFFILELLLVGLLALIGEIPWWLWFVASAVLYVALWTYDNQHLVRVWIHRAPPVLLVIAATAGLLFLAAGVAALYWRAQDATTRSNAVGTLDQALLTVMKVATKQLHDPIKLDVILANLGKLPTTKAQVHVGFLVTRSPTPMTVIDKEFAGIFADKNRLPMYDLTAVPGTGQLLHIWTPLVTEEVIKEVGAGKKNFFVFIVAEYTDAKTPRGKRIVTEVAFRSSPYAPPMQSWSLVRDRSYLSD